MLSTRLSYLQKALNLLLFNRHLPDFGIYAFDILNFMQPFCLAGLFIR